MLEDFAALGVLITIIGFLVYTQVPRHWQTPLGFTLIVFGWVPAGLIVLALLKHPAIMAPALFILGILVSQRRRAS